MRICHDRDSNITLDAEFMAQRFGLSVATLRRLTRWGALQSRMEVGRAEDAGRHRISLRCGNRVWQAVLDAEGEIISEEIRRVRGERRFRKSERT